MPRHQVWARRPDLDGASAPKEVEDDHDNGDEQKNVDCGRRDVEREEAKNHMTTRITARIASIFQPFRNGPRDCDRGL